MNTELAKWISDYDNRNVVLSVEMGGISDEYEQAIQALAVEIMRNLIDVNVPHNGENIASKITQATDVAIKQIAEKYGFSGAQVGAAQNIASVFWFKTPDKAIESMKQIDKERIIKIQQGDFGKLKIIKICN